MFRCFPDHYPQSTVPTKCFALRRVHLRACTFVFRFPNNLFRYLVKNTRNTCHSFGHRRILISHDRPCKNLITLERVDQQTKQIGLKKVPYLLQSLIKKKPVLRGEIYTDFKTIKEVTLAWKVVLKKKNDLYCKTEGSSLLVSYPDYSVEKNRLRRVPRTFSTKFYSGSSTLSTQ